MTEAEIGVMLFEDEGRDHDPKNADGVWKLRKTRK